jgi:hypothetical protein
MSVRDPADPELLGAGHEHAGDFVEVGLERGGEVGRFRFGVSGQGRALVQRVLEARPFGATPGLAYRYFYAGQGGYGTPVTPLLYVRVEHGPDVRTLELESPEDLARGLEWFRRVPNLAAAAHLRAAT